MDETVITFLEALKDCVCEEVTENGSLCFCGIIVGDTHISMAGFGDCEEDCGEAWVRIVSIQPNATSTGPNPWGRQSCAIPYAITLEVGVERCIEIPEGGEAPTAEALKEASDLQIKDMQALYRAIMCCDHFPDKTLGNWLPTGPQGGLVGGTWSVAVGTV